MLATDPVADELTATLRAAIERAAILRRQSDAELAFRDAEVARLEAACTAAFIQADTADKDEAKAVEALREHYRHAEQEEEQR